MCATVNHEYVSHHALNHQQDNLCLSMALGSYKPCMLVPMEPGNKTHPPDWVLFPQCNPVWASAPTWIEPLAPILIR